jgi:hypothetical protein
MVSGTFYLWNYAKIPGAAEAPPSKWPKTSALEKGEKTATLILFGHPECPCSKASVGELNTIMAKVNQRLKVYVAFVVPKGNEDWLKSSLWDDARLIPGVKTLVDEDGKEASRFNARTSGQAILYDENGELVFSGGITGARGHYGSNVGENAIISFVNEKKVSVRSTPVYGCGLYKYSTSTDEQG